MDVSLFSRCTASKTSLFTVLFFGHGQLQSFPFIPHPFSFFNFFFFYQPSAFTRRPSLCPRARLSSLLSAASGNKSLAVSRQILALQRLGERRSSQRVVTAECERGLRTTLRSCPGHVDGNVIGRGRGLMLGSHLCPLWCHKNDNFLAESLEV